MLVVTHPSHPLARRRRVSPADLDGARFVAFDHDLPIRRAIDRALKQHGVKVDVAMEFDNVETIKQAIGIAAGISILPAPTVQKESEIEDAGRGGAGAARPRPSGGHHPPAEAATSPPPSRASSPSSGTTTPARRRRRRCPVPRLPAPGPPPAAWYGSRMTVMAWR